MDTKKEDRKAYEDGRKEADYISNNPVSYAISGGVRNRPSDPSKAQAYDKGLKREKLDKDK